MSMLTSWKEFVSGAVFAAILDAHAVESHHMLYFRRDNNCNMQDMRVIRHWVRLVQLSCATSRCDKLDEMVSFDIYGTNFPHASPQSQHLWLDRKHLDVVWQIGI